jgi:hypothetical protein
MSHIFCGFVNIFDVGNIVFYLGTHQNGAAFQFI